MRIESDPVADRGSGSKSDDIELPDRTQGRSDKGPGGRRFPRLGFDALFHESRPSQDLIGDGTVEFFKVYKRRWFGLVQLTLLNIVVSWDVSSIYSNNFAAFICTGFFVWQDSLYCLAQDASLKPRDRCIFVRPQHMCLMQCSWADEWRCTVPASRTIRLTFPTTLVVDLFARHLQCCRVLQHLGEHCQLALHRLPLVLCRHLTIGHLCPPLGPQAVHHHLFGAHPMRQLDSIWRQPGFTSQLWRRHVWPDPHRLLTAFCAGGADQVLGPVVHQPRPCGRHRPDEPGQSFWCCNRAVDHAFLGLFRK